METINSIASGAAKLVWGENPTNTSTDSTTPNANTSDENQKPLTDRTVNPAAKIPKMNTETQGQEPVSGKLGDVSKCEPFDAGNIGSNAPPFCEPRSIISVWTLWSIVNTY